VVTDNYLDCVGDAFDRACERRLRGALSVALPGSALNGGDWESVMEDALKTAGVDDTWLEAVAKAGPVLLRWPKATVARPGATLRTEEAEVAPETYSWDHHPLSLYTVVHLDAGIEGGRQHSSFLAFNVPGNDVTKGDVAFPYLPPFRYACEYCL